MRCSLCNEELQPVGKDQVRDRVPPYVFATQSSFACCPRCGRLYWPATHVERMREELKLFGDPHRPG
jgi:uncharacterized protein with PIN domain